MVVIKFTFNFGGHKGGPSLVHLVESTHSARQGLVLSNHLSILNQPKANIKVRATKLYTKNDDKFDETIIVATRDSPRQTPCEIEFVVTASAIDNNNLT